MFGVRDAEAQVGGQLRVTWWPRGLRWMQPRLLTRSQRSRDLAFAVGYAVVVVALSFFAGRVMGGGDTPVILLMTLPGYVAALALRRWSPIASLGCAWFAAGIHMMTFGAPSVVDLGVLIVLYATAAYGHAVEQALGVTSAGLGGFAGAHYLLGTFGSRNVPEPMFIAGMITLGGFFASAWLGGVVVRMIRVVAANAARKRVAEEERAYAERETDVQLERLRFAREMHDVVAHSLAVIIAQSDGARYAARGNPEAASNTLRAIGEVARDALGDVRGILAELRHVEGLAPQPSLADCDLLCANSREAGLPLEVVETGHRVPLGTANELAAYRIVQEGLTNALRHGALASPVTLHIDWRQDGLHLELRNACQAEAPSFTAGHGLTGMRERAVLSGGTLTADVTESGEFLLVVDLPVYAPSGSSSGESAA